MIPHRLLRIAPFLAALLAAPAAPAAAAQEVVVYSARKEELIKPVFDAFTRETGIRVTLLTGKAGELARRVEIERDSPRGDVFIGTAAGITELLREKGLLAPYRGAALRDVPEEFRAPDGSWVGVTARARVLIYNTRLVKEPPTSVFELTDPRWKGKVAVASMGERTTVGWLAAILHQKGEEFTSRYVQALRANGLKVLGNNTDVRRALARGEFAVGITNHYYYLLQLNENPKSPVGIVYPDQGPDQMGTPVFSITAAILRGARHADEAQRLVDFLLGARGNRLLVEGEFELPILANVTPVGDDKGVRPLGRFKKTPATQLQLADLEPRVERLYGALFVP